MKRVRILLFLSLLVLFFCSCLMNNPAVTSQGFETWLAAKMTAAPQADLTGKWDAGSAVSGGWGEGNFIQEQANFSGTLGLYYIKGAVSGSDLYFALISNGVVYYTGTMSKTGADSFAGKAVKNALVDSEAAKTAETYAISFQKMH